jgi:hypothetical protein
MPGTTHNVNITLKLNQNINKNPEQQPKTDYKFFFKIGISPKPQLSQIEEVTGKNWADSHWKRTENAN